jgi:hypothetical protein
MSLTNGILAVSLALGALALPALAEVKAPTVDKSGCNAAQKPVTSGGCVAKLTVDPAIKAKNLKPVPVVTTGSTLSLTTRAAHPRR